MMKKILLLLTLSPILFSDIIGGIAITVDNETITIYEIQQEQKITKQNVKNTVDSLIRSKLEHIEAKERHISVTDQEVLDDLKKMAKSNNLSLSQLYEAMSSARNLSESQTKDKTKEKILKQKLFDAVAMSKMEEPTDEEVQEYYNLHLSDYQTPKSVDTILYSAQNKVALEQKISNPMMQIPGVKTENTRIDTAKINPRLAQLIIRTKDNSFTPILPQMGSTGHMAFYILQKNDMNTPPLELIRPQVENKIMDDYREHILNEHFQRLRVNADIKILRLPKN
ncbi:MAG TPA: peptidyl-prolyl cis-trans isomerase [Sulfurimonas sp.]|nr:peptidyl-prolyl cis-trans isomerase [Sulfurimonas sp.]